MAKNVTSSRFIDLPTDILLEILGRLPASSIILCCRLVCRRMDQLSRNSHLWVQYLNQTKDVLRPQLDLEIGTTKFERMLCETETLKKIWSDDSALQVAPRSWRSAPYTPNTSRGTPVGIMGEYMILERRHEEEHSCSWVFIHDQDGPVIFKFTILETELGILTTCYMDSNTNTFYLTYIEATSLVVMGFQTNVSGPHKAFEYRSCLRSDCDVSWLRVQDGFAFVHYYDYGSSGRFEVDVVNLRKRDVSRFKLPPLVSLLPGIPNSEETFTKCTATDTHLICVVDQSKETGCVVLRRPTTTDLDSQPLDSNQWLLGEGVHLGSTVICNLPDAYTVTSYVIPCSSTSFAIVQIWQKSPGSSHPYDQSWSIIIRVLLLTTLNEKVSIEDIESITIPGLLENSLLPVPPHPARYVLGVLGVETERPTNGNRAKHEYVALKIDLPCPERNSTLENKCQITLTKMCFAPVVDTSKEETEVSYFDHFSGKIALTLSRLTPPGANVVIDYLSTAML